MNDLSFILFTSIFLFGVLAALLIFKRFYIYAEKVVLNLVFEKNDKI